MLVSDVSGTGRRILVAGDSNTKFWTGHDTLEATSSVYRGVDIEHLGASTAHNLLSPNHAGSRLLELLERRWNGYGCVILSFGRIDCRVHLVRAAVLNNTSLQAAVQATAANYLRFAREIP